MSVMKPAVVATIALALVVASGLALTPSARAQSITPAQQEEARGLFEAGAATFSEGRYEEALGYFERSYAITGAPELLYNIGHTAERIRHDERAVEAFEQYLEARPDSDERASIEARIANLRQAIAERATNEEALRHAAEAGEGAGEGVGDGADDGSEAEDGGEESLAAASSEPSPAGWIVLGVGGAIGVAGAVLLGLASAAANEVTGAPSGTPWVDVRDAYSNADAFGVTGGILLALGIATMGAGLVWALAEQTSGARAEVAIGPGQLTLRGAL